jgi:uncharacterized protein YacL
VQVSGRATIKLEGEALRSKPGSSMQIGGIQREFDVTDQLQAYFRERGTVAMIKVTVIHASDTELVKLRDWKDGTCTFETDTGRVYTIANAAVANVGDLSNGEVEVTLMGDPAEE